MCTCGLLFKTLKVIRTRLRQPLVDGKMKYTGLWQTLRLVIAEEGAASLYGGLSAHLMRVVPNAAVMYAIYEGVLKWGEAKIGGQHYHRISERVSPSAPFLRTLSSYHGISSLCMSPTSQSFPHPFLHIFILYFAFALPPLLISSAFLDSFKPYLPHK